MHRSCSDNAFVALRIAVRGSFCVAPVIVGNAIAALPVAHEHGLSNAAPPVGVISAAPPDGSIIVIGSVLIAVVWPSGGIFKHGRRRLPNHLQFPTDISPTKKT